MVNKLELKTLFGIEEILKLDNIFKQLLEDKTIDIIYVSICEDILTKCRNTYNVRDFKNKYYDIMNYIFNDNRIIITDNQNYKLLASTELCSIFNKKIIFNIKKELLTNNLDLPDKYITIHCKLLSLKDNSYFGRDMYNRYSNILIDILQKYNGNIILLGEKEIKYCNEYEILDTFSIYNDVIKLNNVKDYTINNSENNNDLQDLKNSFEIINKSELNITLSFSGIRTICLFFSQNILGVKYENDDHFHQYNESNFHHFDENIHLHYNYENYLEALKKLLYVKN